VVVEKRAEIGGAETGKKKARKLQTFDQILKGGRAEVL
jgi:hypothetical protein